MARSVIDRFLSPWVVLGLLALLLVAGALLTPVREQQYTQPLLTTHSAADGGARGLYRTAARLGWRTERRERAMRVPLDSMAVYAVLGPPQDLTSSEVTQLLGAVWRGAGLLVVPGPGAPLADSLGVQQRLIRRRSARTRPLPTVLAEELLMVPDDSAADALLSPVRHVLDFERTQRDVIRFIEAPGVEDTSHTRLLGAAGTAVAAGFPYGRGRVVAVAEPALLRNSELRDTPMGIATVRMLQWVTPVGVDRLVFDEYHFGYGERLGFFEMIAGALAGTAFGRVALIASAAALLLLASVAPRPLLPPLRSRIERRSPLEHVTALAQAYEQVQATRTAMHRLVRGVRRRHQTNQRAGDDDEWLRRVTARHPDLANDVNAVRHALADPVQEGTLVAAGQALGRLEDRLYPHHHEMET